MSERIYKTGELVEYYFKNEKRRGTITEVLHRWNTSEDCVGWGLGQWYEIDGQVLVAGVQITRLVRGLGRSAKDGKRQRQIAKNIGKFVFAEGDGDGVILGLDNRGRYIYVADSVPKEIVCDFAAFVFFHGQARDSDIELREKGWFPFCVENGQFRDFIHAQNIRSVSEIDMNKGIISRITSLQFAEDNDDGLYLFGGDDYGRVISIIYRRRSASEEENTKDAPWVKEVIKQFEDGTFTDHDLLEIEEGWIPREELEQAEDRPVYKPLTFSEVWRTDEPRRGLLIPFKLN